MNDEKNEVIDNSNENSDIEELNVSNNSELENSTINQENVMGSDDNTKKPKEKKKSRGRTGRYGRAVPSSQKAAFTNSTFSR